MGVLAIMAQLYVLNFGFGKCGTNNGGDRSWQTGETTDKFIYFERSKYLLRT